MLHAHWGRRAAAFVVDALLVLLPVWLAFRFLAVESLPWAGLASGIVFFSYGTIFEALWRVTPGKVIFGLEVRAIWGPVSLAKAAVRNVPRFFWYIFPLLDFLMGMSMEGDPRQRFSDRLLGTVVVQHRHADTPATHQGKPLPTHFHRELNCHACGGVLQDAGDRILQCQACGLLQ